MKTKGINIIISILAFIMTSCGSNDEPEIVNNTIERSKDFIGRLYTYVPNGTASYNYAKNEIQFYNDNILCIREFKEMAQFPLYVNKYTYDIQGKFISLEDGQSIEIVSEDCISYKGNPYTITSTNNEYVYVTENDDDNSGTNPPDDNNINPNIKITISPISDSSEINFVISVKGTEIEPTYVRLEYLISPVKLENPKLTNTRDARWVGHPISTTWNYMTYVIGPRYSYVYYQVKALINKQTYTSDINYGRLVNG